MKKAQWTWKRTGRFQMEGLGEQSNFQFHLFSVRYLPWSLFDREFIVTCDRCTLDLVKFQLIRLRRGTPQVRFSSRFVKVRRALHSGCITHQPFAITGTLGTYTTHAPWNYTAWHLRRYFRLLVRWLRGNISQGGFSVKHLLHYKNAHASSCPGAHFAGMRNLEEKWPFTSKISYRIESSAGKHYNAKPNLRLVKTWNHGL